MINSVPVHAVILHKKRILTSCDKLDKPGIYALKCPL